MPKWLTDEWTGTQLTPDQGIEELVLGNSSFVATRGITDFASYESEQHPFVTMLSCCDSRVHGMVFNFDPMNRIFEIRNIGNQLRPSCGSIDYGINSLHTPIFLILGHTNCGAVRAAMGDFRNESLEMIDELCDLHLPLMGDRGTGKFEDRWLLNIERNVDYQVALATRRYRSKVEDGKLAIVGAVYDFINAYGFGHGSMVLINLDGMTSREQMLASDALPRLEEVLAKANISRKLSALKE
ncbi:MAG: carbonic anhydrase [Candidatus Methylacidiphilales bacterium]|nr:carbonic anhydrase [Candidatus Methylacidiphilales bacterium]